MKTTAYIVKLGAVLALLALNGCKKDPFGDIVPPPPAQARSTTFSVHLPGQNVVTSRAMSESDELNIQRIDILLFRKDPQGNELLENNLIVLSPDIRQAAPGSRFYSFDAELPTGSGYSLMLLANSASIMSDPAHTALLNPGTNRTAVTAGLLYSHTGKWDTQTPALIPMWGELNDVSLVPGGIYATIKMNRLLAKINVSVDPAQANSVHEKSKPFVLQNIYLYNFYSNARVIPASGNYDPATQTITAPTLPASPASLPTLTYAAENTSGFNGLSNEIYLFESEESDPEATDTPCIVLEGSFGGENGQFYRIDLLIQEKDAQGNETETQLALLRNHTYEIVITDVLGRGYQSAADAARTRPVNMAVKIFTFNDGETRNIIFDGQYHMAISHETMHFDKAERTVSSTDNVLTVQTNNPLGWTAEVIEESVPNWLTISTTSGPGGEGVPASEITLTAGPYNNAAAPRTAKIRLEAGRLLFDVQVIQSHLDGLSLKITDKDGNDIHELLFRSNPDNPILPDDLEFQVHWTPSPCQIGVTMVGDKLFEFDGTGIADGAPLNDVPGFREFTISPTPFSLSDIDPDTGIPFMEKGAMVQFTVTNGEESITRNIYIRHQCLNILFDDFEPLCYMGKGKSFKVRSNSTWKIEEIDAEYDGLMIPTNFNEGQTGGNDTKTGRELTYTMMRATTEWNGIHGIGQSGRKVRLRFTDQNGVFPDVIKTITAITPDPNSYIAPPVNNYLYIPIRKLFWIWEGELDREIPHNLSFVGDMVWNSIPHEVPHEIVRYNNSPNPLDWAIRVNTANNGEEGNFVMGVADPQQGGYLWSWHVWCTHYDPETDNLVNTWHANPVKPVFMKRNLGATAPPGAAYQEEQLTEYTIGMFYQWGRKDPLPGVNQNAIDNYTYSMAMTDTPEGIARRRVLYKNASQSLTISYTQGVPEVRNLPNAIRNPLNYYIAANGHSIADWITSSTQREYQNDYLWLDKDNRKAFYDPCPEGWRVPYRNHEAGNDYNSFNGIAEETMNHNYFRNEGIYMGNPNSPDTYTYIPVSGFVNATSFAMWQMNTIMRLWIANTTTHNAYHLSGLQNEVQYSGIYATRAHSQNIRCVRDPENWYP